MAKKRKSRRPVEASPGWPLFLCQLCGRPITDVRECMAQVYGNSTVVFVHREEIPPGRGLNRANWMPMAIYLTNALTACQYNLRNAEAALNEWNRQQSMLHDLLSMSHELAAETTPR